MGNGERLTDAELSLVIASHEQGYSDLYSVATIDALRELQARRQRDAVLERLATALREGFAYEDASEAVRQESLAHPSPDGSNSYDRFARAQAAVAGIQASREQLRATLAELAGLAAGDGDAGGVR